MKCSLLIELSLPMLFCVDTVISASLMKDRPIPLEHSCNRLPYILKDTELQFSYSAEHLKYQSCAVTIIGKAYEHICVEFVQYYLDCDTNIVLIDGTVSSLNRKTYRCDSNHSSDFCSSETTLEVIFDRKNGKREDDFGHVELKIYGKGNTDTTEASIITAVVVVGGILALIFLLIMSAFILSRVLYRHKPSCRQRQYPDQQRSQEEIPLGPPPPYEEPESTEAEATTL